jgi:hypothetical protein
VALLTERLDHHRGRGQQQITVKHVTTNNVTADQAIIADSVTTGVGAPRSVASPALLTANSEAPMPILSEARQPLVGVGGVEKKKCATPPCKAPTARHAAKPNRNDQGSDVVRPRYAAIASAGCTELEAARRKVSKTGIIGTACAQKRQSGQ